LRKLPWQGRRGVPTFGRAPQDKDLWMKPVTARFHFKLANGRLVEVSETAADK